MQKEIKYNTYDASDFADQYFGFADWMPDCSKEDILNLMILFASHILNGNNN